MSRDWRSVSPAMRWLWLPLLLAFSQSARAAEPSTPVGAQVYAKYCMLCHGATGKGDGRAAVIQQRKPADLTKSTQTHAYKLDIVRRGGAALNRSSSMPAWSDVLSEEEISQVVAYLQTFVDQETLHALKPASSAASVSRKDR